MLGWTRIPLPRSRSTRTFFFACRSVAFSAMASSNGSPGIANWTTAPLGAKTSAYVKPFRATFKDMRDGVEKTWDFVEAHDAVSVLVYHADDDAFLLVKQFRPAVYASALRRTPKQEVSVEDAFTYELCAGILDKPHLDIFETAREEIVEELGFDVDASSIRQITSYHSSTGVSGTITHLMYAEVRESNRVGSGGGIDTEQIEVVKLPVSDAYSWMMDAKRARSAGLLFAFSWFLNVFRAKNSS